jgi:hypothetical protein
MPPERAPKQIPYYQQIGKRDPERSRRRRFIFLELNGIISSAFEDFYADYSIKNTGDYNDSSVFLNLSRKWC